MKKLWVVLFSMFFLAACTNEYPAEKSHLEDIIFFEQDNQSNQLIFSEGSLTIIQSGLEIKPDMDPKEGEGKEPSEVVYRDIQVKTKGDTYFITSGDELSLELQRIGERILQDENGERYGTSQTLN
ncbi:hypothetical protein [Paenisporosarcina quisquiliarum]|uniref:hypothetical protein n=1 Tax=Paenisporosarcina quisquiliarum TaxID=365346 RepID=UPI0037360139